jgi:hypothetical protein
MSCVRPANTFPAFPSWAGAAAGIAAINSIGNLGGYFGSKIFGHGQAPWPKIIRAHGAGLFGCVRLRKLRVSAMVRVPQRTPGRPPLQDSPAATERGNDHFRFHTGGAARQSFFTNCDGLSGVCDSRRRVDRRSCSKKSWQAAPRWRALPMAKGGCMCRISPA